MKDKTFSLNTVLVIVLALALSAGVLVRAFMPAVILPQLNIPNLTLLSVLVLLIDRRTAPGAGRRYGWVAVLSAAAFGLLPWAAGLAELSQVWKMALVGGIVFTACTWLFTSLCQRLSSGPSARGAAWISALCIYLAAQCFAGILL